MLNEELNDREKNILRHIIQQFIATAAPVGSRNIAKNYNLNISPATVRNIMADLEDSGFINHPHTSAGRIPTDKGYRLYVDFLMDVQELRKSEKGIINKNLEETSIESDELFQIASVLLSNITHQLACVSYPKLDTGYLEKIQIVSLSSTRILVIITIKSGLVKTITLELSSDIKISQIESVQSLLNEKLCGLTFKEIRATFKERFKDIEDDHKAIIRVFVDSVDKIFKDTNKTNKLVIKGAKEFIKQPEFEDPNKFQSVIELIEDEEIIVNIMEKSTDASPDQVYISIGKENQKEELLEFSFVSKDYKLGDVSGTLGIIGPKRMDYSKVVAIVDYMAKMLSEVITNPNQK